ncbi:MAG TPA: type II secretion system F family protein [Blastocatellia bacterium]|nr:type II secretion system F family protein [Blastocatellia bacterium]HMX24550.1 type II secretion system F family protein [Blastocatellia bacterium]HMY71425.1 type II secretion system F family protein [Blastocatellia bacterium]HMZ17182.1 type II secretion system F family protein [Blastocatellia bacterium]HNG31875.1 type II secretion system F family protein [Blastocatellia bacterium]
MSLVLFLFPALIAAVFLIVAFYFFVSRDTDAYRKRIDERMKQLVQERGGASQREMQLLKDELLSTVPVFHRALIRFEIFNKLQTMLQQADVKITVYRFIISSMIGGFIAGLIAFFFSRSLVAMFILTVVVMIAPLLWVSAKRRRRFNTFLEQLPDALELMVRSLQAGHSFSSALQMVATEMPDPIAREFGKTYEEQNLGLNIKSALENMVERVPILDLKLCVTAVLIQREIGGNLSEVLRNISHTIRERFRIQGEIRTKSAQARLSGYIVSALPFFLFFWINLVNPGYMKTLYDHPNGIYILGTGIVMQMVGWLIIRKIVDIKV